MPWLPESLFLFSGGRLLQQRVPVSTDIQNSMYNTSQFTKFSHMSYLTEITTPLYYWFS